MRFVLASLLLVALAGCADRAEAPAAPPDAEAPEDTRVTVRGVVVETLYEGTALRVDHEAMPDLGMPAMRMALPLETPALAENLAPGDKVALTIEAAPRLRVTAVTPLPAGTELVLAADSSAADAPAADSAAGR